MKLWLLYTLIGTICMGLQPALYRMILTKNSSLSWQTVTFFAHTTMYIIEIIYIIKQVDFKPNNNMFLMMTGGGLGAIATITLINVLKLQKATITNAIAMNSIILIPIFSYILMKEIISYKVIIGIGLVLGAGLLLTL